jgi:predicted phage terminase large subunit-like protein
VPSLIELEAERLRRSLYAFLVAAWPLIEPGASFVSGMHIEAICSLLEAVSRGEVRGLLINVPPRHGKSSIVSVAWPAWMWATRPQTRWLFASYAEQLAVRDSVRCRRLLESRWYRERWGARVELASDQNLKQRFETTAGGARIATSVGGGATGEGGEIIVIDDPHKIEEIASTAAREGVLDWYDGTISTRQNDPRTGANIVIGQRLHERDLFGHLLESGEYEHLCLPAEYDPAHPFCWPGDPRSRPGEPLWPERYGSAELARLKRRLGSFGAASQLQQLPAPAEGGIFKRHWWRFYDPSGRLPCFERFLQSWDLTYGAGERADYVVGQLWGQIGADSYLLRQLRQRLEITETMAEIRSMSRSLQEQFRPQGTTKILIEKAANGAAVISMLQREIPGIVAVPLQGSKLSRALAVSPQVEAGNVWLPGFASADGSGFDRGRTEQWVQEFVRELETFPHAAYDDQTDAMTQALLRLAVPMPRLRLLG